MTIVGRKTTTASLSLFFSHFRARNILSLRKIVIHTVDCSDQMGFFFLAMMSAPSIRPADSDSAPRIPLSGPQIATRLREFLAGPLFIHFEDTCTPLFSIFRGIFCPRTFLEIYPFFRDFGNGHAVPKSH